MKVDNPKWNKYDECECNECPLNEVDDCCTDWMADHGGFCPTATTYQEAVRVAEGVSA